MTSDERSLPATLRAVVNATTPATRVIADLAPHLLQRNVLQGSNATARPKLLSHKQSQRGLLANIGRTPARILLPSSSSQAERTSTASALDLAVVESVDELLALPVDPPTSSDQRLLTATSGSHGHHAGSAQAQQQVPFFAGYQATAPAASQARRNRRRRRAYLGESHLGISHGSEMGLRQRLDQARGLLDEGGSTTSSVIGSDETAEAEGEFEIIRHAHANTPTKPKRVASQTTPRVRRTMAASHYSTGPDAAASDRLSRAELLQDIQEIEQDQKHLGTRRQVLTDEAAALDERISRLQAAREDLRRGLLGLKEEELELEDELEGVREQLAQVEMASSTATITASAASPRASVPQTSRRRRGPAFLPKEHDSLPVGVAFMTLQGHNAPIAALDFSEPYGLLVSSTEGIDDSSMRVWDLTTGEQIETLQSTKPEQATKCLQVESTFCVSGSADGHLKVWDLEKLDEVPVDNSGSPRLDGEDEEDKGPCVLDLEAHTKAVTSLYFDGPCLVTGSSDKTLKQWDLEKGVPIITMDIVWAMNDQSNSQTLSASPSLADLERHTGPPLGSDPLHLSNRSKRPAMGAKGQSLARLSSQHYRLSDTGMHDFSQPWTSQDSHSSDFSVPTPSYADGSWDLYSDFVGSLQFWGYALASGSADGCVRMWDMRTGQAHRTLIGHIAPVTTLQFDEYHLVSGSLDKSIRVWDLRTGSISDTLRFDGPITSLQFDSRKIVAAAGDNGVKIYNRTSMQHESLEINGHTSPVERVRFMDRYLASGAKDHTIKLWSVQ